MGSRNYTIKGIARTTGVSAGTVDRVLHNQGDTSRISRGEIQKVLDEVDYRPNMFAIGLAAKGRYRIICIVPYYTEYDYWSFAAQGIERAAQELRPFNVGIDYVFYNYTDGTSYEKACVSLQAELVDTVLIAPNSQDETLRLTSHLESKEVPYASISFNMEQTHALCYTGQDPKISGYTAAKTLMSCYQGGQGIMLFLNNQRNSPAEVWMRHHLEGFVRYFATEHKSLIICDAVLHKENAASNEGLLDIFFVEYPEVTLGAVFSSHVYQVVDYLQKKRHRLDTLANYDLLQKNVEHLRDGEANYLIGQRPGLQGYCGVKALYDYTVFKKLVTTVKYMPIDILMKENIDFYFEFE